MNRKRKFFNLTLWILKGLPILYLAFNFAAYGQTNISGVINTVSARIDAVYSKVNTDFDSVHVNSVVGFTVGDTVMVHMTVGANFYPAYHPLEGKMAATNNSGKYAIFILEGIDVTNNYLILNSTLPNFSPLVAGEYGQIIKVPTYKRARITGTLTCNPYNPATGTGGILVLIVKQGLVFDADINVDGKGFPGADPDIAQYSGTCSIEDTLTYLRLNFASSQANYTALKGYSVAFTTNDSTRGRGAITNGGGGGNGLYSGGGGGANGGDGGDGGFESESCGVAKDTIGGRGGNATILFYLADNRIGLGGGGGTSSQNLPSRKATSGGDGGGIVIIICDSLKGGDNGLKNIYARGQSVADSATAGAGGGGGGGAIILHVNKPFNRPKLWVSGGDGGKIANTAPEACGPGGGGGAGVIWFNGLSLDGPVDDFNAGKNGTFNGLQNGASSGTGKTPVKNLIIPTRGFIFNYIPDADTICKNDAPKPINAAPSVGGTGVFIYKWLESADSINWIPAEGTRNQVTYTPSPATNTTMFYRRFVTAGFIMDSSNVVKMFVLPLLTNNAIKPDTIVCTNLNAGTLYPNLPMAGGNGSYRYKWEKSTDNTFSSPDSVGDFSDYLTPVFTDTTWYRRKVVSNACKSTSNSIKITVLPVISNNTLSPDQEICTTRTPDLLIGNAPGGGADTYTYKWQEKSVAFWSDTVTTPDFQPPALTSSQQYRRIAYSGPASTCKDTSAVLIVSVMPDITNNVLNPISQDTLCFGLNGEILSADSAKNGNGTYSYYWQKNNVNAAFGNEMTGFDPGILTANTTFRRIVSSGNNPDSLQRCWSTSNERTISIVESISNNNLSISKTAWCQGKTPDNITGSLPLSGGGTYTYSWQNKLPAGNWENRAETTRNFNTPVITSNVDYRRVVKSGLIQTCIDTSNIISIVMQDNILNNRINNDAAVFVCFDEDSTLQATFPGVLTGGDGVKYTYIWSQSLTVDGTYVDALQNVKTDSVYLTENIQTTRYYKRSVTSGDCENTSLPVKIETLPLPELTNLAVDMNEICYNKLYSLLNTSIQFGVSPYIVSFNDGQGFTESRTFTSGTETIQPQINNPSLTPGFIDYNFKVVSIEDSKGCFAKAGNLDPFSAPLRVYTTPMPSRVSDTLVESCSSTLQIFVNPSIGASSWHLRNINEITTDNTTNPNINLIASYDSDHDYASVSLAYVEDIANCPSDSIFVDAILYDNPDSIKNIYRVVDNFDNVIGDTVIIFISDNQQFKADAIISGIPGWSITSGEGVLSDSTLSAINITGLVQDDPAFLKYSISNGVCPANTRTIKIIRKEILVYDGFSPNDDGINEELWAVGLADDEVDFKFQIFSSSGNFIREIVRKDIKEVDLANNQVVLWDGTTNKGGAGNFIPDGTYYYVLLVKYHDENFNKKGYIIVKR